MYTLRVCNQLRNGVRAEQPGPVRNSLLRLELKRVVGRVAGVFVDRLEITAILGIGHEGLRHRRGAAAQLFDPAVVGNRYPVERGLARLELVEELLPERQSFGV